MHVQLEKHDALIILFGGTSLLSVIILAAIYTGFSITRTASTPQPINISSPQPAVTIAVPQQAAPKVEVACPAAHVDVHVPTAAAPIVNVSTPPATVTVVEREKAETPKATPVAPPPTPPKVEAKPVPASLETKQHSEAEEIGIDGLYVYAEKYIDAYCRKLGLDPAIEKSRWDAKWNVRVSTAVSDGGTEQALMDRTIVDCHSYFDQNASPDKVVEACRLLLQIKNSKLTMIDAMRNALTKDNIIKTVAFLQQEIK